MHISNSINLRWFLTWKNNQQQCLSRKKMGCLMLKVKLGQFTGFGFQNAQNGNRKRSSSYCWWKKSGKPVEVGSLSRYLQTFLHPSWCRISEPSTVSSIFKCELLVQGAHLNRNTNECSLQESQVISVSPFAQVEGFGRYPPVKQLCGWDAKTRAPIKQTHLQMYPACNWRSHT